MMSIDELIAELKFAGGLREACLIIGLNGGNQLTGYANGEGIVQTIVGNKAHEILETDVSEKWDSSGEESRHKIIETCFKETPDKRSEQGLEAIAQLVRGGLVTWMVATDCGCVLSRDLMASKVITERSIIRLTETTLEAVKRKCALPGPKFIDAGEWLIAGCTVDRDGKRLLDETKTSLMNAMRKLGVFLCWGWSARNCAVKEFLGAGLKESSTVYLLGNDQRHHGLGPLGTKPKWLSDDRNKPENPDTAYLVKLAAAMFPTPQKSPAIADSAALADTATETTTNFVALPTQPTKSILPAGGNATAASSAQYQWLCDDDVLDSVHDPKKPIILIGADGTVLRRQIAEGCRESWAKEGISVPVREIDIRALHDLLLPAIRTNPKPRCLIVVTDIPLDVRLNGHIAAMQEIVARAFSDFDRLVVIANAEAVNRIIKRWPKTDAKRHRVESLNIWRKADACLAPTSFGKMLKRNNVRIGNTHGNNGDLVQLASDMASRARTFHEARSRVDGRDAATDHLHSAVPVWLDLARPLGNSEHSAEELLSHWRALMPIDDDGAGGNLSLEAIPREPTPSTPSTPSPVAEEVLPDINIVRRTKSSKEE